MTFRKKHWQDHLGVSFGQEDEAVQTGNKEGLTVGGYYGTAALTLDDGDFGRLQLTSSGALKVDLVSGDTVVVSVGTITTGSITDVAKLYSGTINSASVANIVKGTITEVEGGTVDLVSGVTSVSNLVKGTITEVEGGTVDLVTGVSAVANLAKGTITEVEGGTVDQVTTVSSVTALPSLASYYTGTVTITTPAANGTLTSTINGNVKYITMTTPDMEDTDSTNLLIVDSQGGTMFASGTKAESATALAGSAIEVPITTSHKFVAVGEGTQSASRNIVIGVSYNSI